MNTKQNSCAFTVVLALILSFGLFSNALAAQKKIPTCPASYSGLSGNFKFFADEKDANFEKSLKSGLLKIKKIVRAEKTKEYRHFLKTDASLYREGQKINVNGKQYTIAGYLGSGAEGNVYKVTDSSGQPFTLKKFDYDDQAEAHAEMYAEARADMGEALVLKTISVDPHANILISEYHEGLTIGDVTKHKELLSTAEDEFLIKAYEKFIARNKYYIEHGNVLIRTTDFSLLLIDPF